MKPTDAVTTLAALAQGNRLAAFRHLVQAGPEGLTVGALREALDIPAATLTAHLNTLRRARLIADTREGRAIRVRADFTRMALLLAYLTENCCGGEPCAPADRAAPCR